MIRSSILLAALPLSLALAACGSGDANPGDEDGVETLTTDQERESVTALDDPSLVNLEGDVVAVAGGAETPAPPMLQPIADTQAVDLGPTMGACTFALGDVTLLVAGARDNEISRAKGVVQVDAEDMLLQGEETTGADYVTEGPSLTDGTISVEVRRGAGEGEAYGAESVRWPADLSVRSGLGPERVYRSGTWTCGV
ncbi:hypothetical protein [Paraurantiacibacter namhicola]|uniref:Lipoprotein n=1 Tax=Paraurantiacibacter namhicola TaxID=645517 RepID=A0A1C7D9E4_9SPHN|nr:hypothetical protein [Paraurantiacibacter namhicola]ANU08106.1 hypothetical protein A6F65_01811 [Paraurantiacibacter namhicola]